MALSIWRRLLIQAFLYAVVRALTKLGIAIAASSPLMATTIMISTSVNPLWRAVLFFITEPFCCDGVNQAAGSLLLLVQFVHELPAANRAANLPENGAGKQPRISAGSIRF